jgi:hypothetical protein
MQVQPATFHVSQLYRENKQIFEKTVFQKKSYQRLRTVCHQTIQGPFKRKTIQGLHEDEPGPGPCSYYPLLLLPSPSFFLVAISSLSLHHAPLPPKPQQNGGERARPLAIPHAARLAAPPLRGRQLRRAQQLRCVRQSLRIFLFHGIAGSCLRSCG